MNKFLSAFLIMASTSLILELNVSAAESLSVLLQKGIFAEETEGNLDAAIKIYEEMLKGGDANRALLAQAQYRLGVCELKRGKKEEAEGAFRKAISQFSDQAEIIAKAREQLIEMGKSVSAVVVRQVWSGNGVSGDSISRDSRYLAFIDWDTGNLVVRDLASGRNRRLTENASLKKPIQYAKSCALSPDGKQIAYSWYRDYGTKDYSYGLHVISLENKSSRILLGPKTNSWIAAEDWSPDGKSIVVFSDQRRGTNVTRGISMISVADGAVRQLTSPIAHGNSLRISSDGRYAAYNSRLNLGASATNDIFVVDIQTGTQKLVVEHLGREMFVGWGPRGSDMIFCSDRRGTVDLWSVKIANGQAAEPPRLLKANVGQFQPVGITRDGALFYNARSDDVRDCYVASIDLNSGKILAPPKELPNQMSTGKRGITVSPDGRQLFFEIRSPRQSLVVQDLESSLIREYSISTNQIFGSSAPRPAWSADGQHLALRGRYTQTDQGDSRHALFLLKPNANAPTVISAAEPNSITKYWGMYFKEGMLRYFLSVGMKDPKTDLWDGGHRLWWISHDLTTGKKQEQEIAHFSPPGSGWPNGFVFSSDEKRLFYIRFLGEPPTNRAAISREFTTGKEVELLRSTNQLEILVEPATSGPIIIAAVGGESHGTIVHFLKGIDVIGGAVKERFSVIPPAGARLVQWDGARCKSHILLQKVIDGVEPTTELWTISRENGEMRKTDLVMPGYANVIGCDREGKQIFFQTSGPSKTVRELWVMENFLPEVATKN